MKRASLFLRTGGTICLLGAAFLSLLSAAAGGNAPWLPARAGAAPPAAASWTGAAVSPTQPKNAPAVAPEANPPPPARQTIRLAGTPGEAVAPSSPAPGEGSPAQGVSPPAPPLAVRNLTMKAEPGGIEKVFLELNQFYTPAVFSLEGSNPRIVIDVKGVQNVKRDLAKTTLPGPGRMILRIRTFQDPRQRTLRIVLDMDPTGNYRVNQFFYKAENIYALEIQEETHASPGP